MDCICKICGNRIGNQIYQVKERRINKGESFEYIKCGKCGTLALNEEIDNMYIYYSDNYYSFHNREKRRPWGMRQLRKMLFRGVIAGFFPKGLCLHILSRRMGYARCLYGVKLKYDARILDVGGGVGEWLMRLREVGFRDLTNVDLFAEPPAKDNGIKYIKGDLLKVPLEEPYDLITMHHSFEHMDNPDEILRHCGKLLKDTGKLIMRIPVMGKQAWRDYGTDWYQIDAPRHLFLYTEKAIDMMLKRHGLYIYNIIWDSAADQMKRSAMYKNTSLSFSDFDDKKINRKDHRLAKKLNQKGEGDQACFYIRKVTSK